MNKLNLLGVKRGSKFSPNHIGNDEAIFNLTIAELERIGCRIDVLSEKEFLLKPSIDQQYIFSMAREKNVVEKLKTCELGGKTVINSGFGIDNCFRTNMTKGLVRNNIPYPKSNIVSTAEPGSKAFEDLQGKGFWIKRGDFHAIHKEDVTFVETEEQGRYILQEFNLRGIPDAVISQNLLGDLVKFYGIRGTGFFYLFYPYDHNHHKYAEYEKINGATFHHSFDKDKLKSAADASASALNIYIYGGDAIVGKNGDFHIIDFNDWPSFAPCREIAAPFIAQCLLDNFIINE